VKINLNDRQSRNATSGGVRRARALSAVAASASLLLVLTACGGGDASEDVDTSSVDVTGAEAFIADYIDAPSPFPVEEQLLKRPPADSEFVFVDPGTAITQIQWEVFEAASKALGVTPVRMKAGSDASSISNTFDAVIARKPEGVGISALDPVLYARQLEELRAAGTTVVGTAIQAGDEYGFGPITFGPQDSAFAGELMGAWTIARHEGKATDIVLYNIPEISFSEPMLKAAVAKIKEFCDVCTTRIVDVPVTSLGSDAPQLIVSDVQAHPETDAAIFAADEMVVGLPATLETAGLELSTIAPGSTPASLQQVKDGTQDAVLAMDFQAQIWTVVDQIARGYAGQELSGGQSRGEIIKQFLTKDTVPDDPSSGWAGYPDVAGRFAALWADAE